MSFRFKQFEVHQDLCAMKVGTDGVLLGAWAGGGPQMPDAQARGSLRILDAGTGTGVIALMMAQRYPDAEVTAIDIDEGAVRQAKSNVSMSPFASRIHVLQESLQQHQGMIREQLLCEQQQGVYDAIVSNPPFFIDSLQAPDAQRNMARHTATLSYADLMQSAWRLLKDEGELSVVVPFDYRRRMDDEAVFCGFFPSRVCAVHTAPHKPPRRYLLAFRKHPCHCEKEQLTIGSAAYCQLTQDFYL